MNWQEDNIKRLARLTPGGYQSTGPLASEPTAWAALALATAGQAPDAERACVWLSECQQRSGAVGVTKDDDQPAWTTSLAMLAWDAWQAATHDQRFQKNIDRAANWAFGARGRTVERNSEFGHDTTIVGWSWAADTHSWLEPTALFVRALRTIGYADHPRTREAVRMLVDRLLPTGGANYGNTRVLDQYLLPHVQPTGLVMWALAGEPTVDPRISASLDYLAEALHEPLGVASLAYAVMGLSAHGRTTAAHESLLAKAFESKAVQTNPYRLALLANAAQAMVLA